MTYAPITIRNCIYHIYPVGSWKWNIEQLAKYQDVFNGKIIFVVATERGTGAGYDVTDYLGKVFKDTPYALISERNDKELRETATLLPLLKVLQKNAPKGFKQNMATFYGHTKGVTHDKDPQVTKATKLWTQMLYDHNLGRWEECIKMLETYLCVGAFKNTRRFSGFPKESRWHYAGTFSWFRDDALFSRDWQKVPQMRYGAEAYLSMHFSQAEAGCIFGKQMSSNLYKYKNAKRIYDSYQPTSVIIRGIRKRQPTMEA